MGSCWDNNLETDLVDNFVQFVTKECEGTNRNKYRYTVKAKSTFTAGNTINVSRTEVIRSTSSVFLASLEEGVEKIRKIFDLKFLSRSTEKRDNTTTITARLETGEGVCPTKVVEVSIIADLLKDDTSYCTINNMNHNVGPNSGRMFYNFGGFPFTNKQASIVTSDAAGNVTCMF